jgi:hypothetical protein
VGGISCGATHFHPPEIIMALLEHSFKPYQYQEYPKMVYPTQDDYPSNGKIAQTPEEEAEIRGDNPAWEVIPVQSRAAVDTGERKFLCDLLVQFGLNPSPSLSVSELRVLVNEMTKPKQEPDPDETNILNG